MIVFAICASTNRSKQLGRKRKAAFALVALAGVLLICELGIRSVYFQWNSDTPTAIGFVVQRGAVAVTKWRARRRVARALKQLGFSELGWGGAPKSIANKIEFALYNTQAGEPLLQEFQDQYEGAFTELVKEVDAVGAKLLVLYLFGGDYHQPESNQRRICRAFYRDLCASQGITFVDATDRLLEYSTEETTLAPYDTHLSRFGNQLVAGELATYIENIRQHHSHHRFSTRPRLLGDLTPNHTEIWRDKPQLPCLVTSNAQGLRMGYELEFPKSKQRVLALGDSFTFGSYLHNQDSYPAILDRLLPAMQVINAGMHGYTITDELGLFRERAKFCEPDFVVLQVLDNDILGLCYYHQNEMAREGRYSFQPRAAELEFFKHVSRELREQP